MSAPHPLEVPGQSYSEVNGSHSFQRSGSQPTIYFFTKALSRSQGGIQDKPRSLRKREGNKGKAELCCRKGPLKKEHGNWKTNELSLGCPIRKNPLYQQKTVQLCCRL